MPTPDWLDDLGATFAGEVSSGFDFATPYAALTATVGGFSDEKLVILKGRFVSTLVGRSVTAANPGTPTPEFTAVSNAVATFRTVVESPLSVLADLMAALAPLESARKLAWEAAAKAAGVVRTLLLAEKLAAAAASSGLPGVTGAWAVAAQARMAAVTAADLLAKAGRAADLTIGAAMHAIDSARDAAFAAIDSVSRITRGTVTSLMAGVDLASSAGFEDLFGELQTVVAYVHAL